MGTALPYLSTAVKAIGTAGTIASTLNTGANLINSASNNSFEQELEQRKLNEKIAKRDAANERAQVIANAQSAERERRSALKRAIARNRAKFGAQGISTQDGSSEAILLGQFSESDSERKERETLDNLRLAAIDNKLKAVKARNTLALTQAKEKDRLSTLSSVTSNTSRLANDTDDLFKIF